MSQETDLANVDGGLAVGVADVDGVQQFDDAAVATSKPGGN